MRLPRTAWQWFLINSAILIFLGAMIPLVTQGQHHPNLFGIYFVTVLIITAVVFFKPEEERATSRWYRRAELLAPIIGDRRRAKRRNILMAGNDMLRCMNLVPANDEMYYDAAYRKYTDGAELDMQLRLPGINAESVHKGAKHVLALTDSVDCQVIQKNNSGGFLVQWYANGRPNPLEQIAIWPIGTTLTNGAVPIGITEYQQPATMPLMGGHTLLLGASGSGKGSVMWSLIIGLADEIKAGRVKLWGIDLKGGVELSVGRTMFDRMAGTVEDAQVLLDDLSVVMSTRLADMVQKGQRKITPTAEQPMYLHVIDEAAALTLGVDPKISKAAMSSLRLILTQGRAPGVAVFAALQDPTKEAFPARDLFTRQIILRLRSESQTRLALAVGSDEEVPAAHSIPESTPGIGYIRDSERGEATKFRAYMVEDELIRHIARDIGDRNVAADQEVRSTGKAPEPSA